MMTTTPQTPPEQPQQYVSEPMSRTISRLVKSIGEVLKGMLKIAAWVFGIAFVILMGMAVYDQLDVSGYFDHDTVTDVYMSRDWLVGEVRRCTMVEFVDAKGNFTGKVANLTCPQEDKTLEPHMMSVTFKGVIDPKTSGGDPRPVPYDWNCVRGEVGFACRPVSTNREH